MAASFQSIRIRITEEIVARIHDGRYPAGMRLIELKIAEEFGVSQSPVREALRELEARRYVESEAYRGARVRVLTAQEVQDAFLVRAMLEECACHLAISRNSDLKPIHKSWVFAKKAAEKQDVRSFIRHDADFHRSLVESAQNRALLRTWESLQAEARFVRPQANRIHEEFGRQHDSIVEALQKGDGVLAGKLVREHLLAVSRAFQSGPPPDGA